MTNLHYTDLRPDTPYIVAAGSNDDFSPGDLFWMDSRDGSIVVCDENTGWLPKDEIPSSLFDGLTIEVADGYEVVTNMRVGGYSALRKKAG